jgi:hypothetical protein
VCIYAPSKEKGKVIKYDCKHVIESAEYLFANVKAVGYISEDQLFTNANR